MTKNNVVLKRNKSFIGKVVSDKSDKTIVVSVETSKIHPIYKKRFKSTKKYHAHDEKNQAKIGDVVKIKTSRPLSALKRFQLSEIIEAKVINKEAVKEKD